MSDEKKCAECRAVAPAHKLSCSSSSGLAIEVPGGDGPRGQEVDAERVRGAMTILDKIIGNLCESDAVREAYAELNELRAKAKAAEMPSLAVHDAWAPRDIRCPDCGKMMTNHVVVTRHFDGPCEESFTGPPLAAAHACSRCDGIIPQDGVEPIVDSDGDVVCRAEIRASDSKRTDKVLRRALGQDLWNRLWGPELEQLGGAVDALIEERLAELRSEAVQSSGTDQGENACSNCGDHPHGCAYCRPRTSPDEPADRGFICRHDPRGVTPTPCPACKRPL